MSSLYPSDRAPGLLVGEGVHISDDAEIGGNVVIYAGTRIGSGCTVGDCAVIGRFPTLGPLSSAPRERPVAAILEDGASVLAGAVVLAGAKVAAGAIVADPAQLPERSGLGAEALPGR